MWLSENCRTGSHPGRTDRPCLGCDCACHVGTIPLPPPQFQDMPFWLAMLIINNLGGDA